MSNLQKRFDTLVNKYQMLLTDSILLGFSGGADSLCLLHQLCVCRTLYGTRVYAAHVNHGIRGKEADRDEAFCRQTADALGVPLFVHHADVPAYASLHGLSIETAAREVRYAFFDACMKQHGIPQLAVAHTANDNLETVLFHLARGSGCDSDREPGGHGRDRGPRRLSPSVGEGTDCQTLLRLCVCRRR